MRGGWAFKSYLIIMENINDIDQYIDETDKWIDMLDKNINTDEELISHLEEIKRIYASIADIDKKILLVQDSQQQQEFQKRLLELKWKFADLAINWVIDWDNKDVTEERRFDSINEGFIHDLEDIIQNNWDKIEIKNIDVENTKKIFLKWEITSDIIDEVNKQLSQEERIILLKELNKENFSIEDLTLLASLFWFKWWILLGWDEGMLEIPYVEYWSWCIIFSDWNMICWNSYEDAYSNYLLSIISTGKISNDKTSINFGTFNKESYYTSDTDNLEKRVKLQDTLAKNVANWKDPNVYEYINKMWVFTKFEFNWGDTIKTELYHKETTWWTDLKLWWWVSVSYEHKFWGNLKSKTSVWASANLLAISNGSLQRKPSQKYDITQNLVFKNGFSIWGKAYTKDFKTVNSSVTIAYNKWRRSAWLAAWTEWIAAWLKINF